MTMQNNRAYLGADGLKNYLKPKADEYIPLVELPSELNPFLESHDIHISAKLMNTLPLGNVKSLPAYYLLNSVDAISKNVVESSSGNTVFSMGLFAKSLGIKSVKAVASNTVTRGKLQLLRLAGIDVLLVDGPICPDAHDPNSSISIARRLGNESGNCNPGQYDNFANPQAHRDVTGPQIFDQLGENLGMFVAGLGTTGTLVGTAGYLKEVLPELRVGGVVRVPNNQVPGVRTSNDLREIDFNWKDILTEDLVAIDEVDAYKSSLDMIRQGILVGPSSGFAYAGACTMIENIINSGNGDMLRGKHVVFVCPDSCFPYVEEYFEILGESSFPEIDNQSSGPIPGFEGNNSNNKPARIDDISPEELYEDIKKTNPKFKIIDVREPREFVDHHIKGSKQVSYYNIEDWATQLKDTELTDSYVFVCSRTGRSLRAASIAKKLGIENVFVLAGGTAAWSAKGFDRVLPNSCLPNNKPIFIKHSS